MTRTNDGPGVRGRYDLRQGAGGYAPIVGALGALAVPGIVVLFTVPRTQSSGHKSLITLAAGLLIVSVIGSLIGSVSLAGIAAEQELTANLPPAVMIAAVPVVVSIVDMLAAFEVLAAIFLPESKTLFALIAGAGGTCSVFFTTFAISDSWFAGPEYEEDRIRLIQKPWILGHAHAYKQTNYVMTVGAVPAALGMILRGFNVTVPISSGAVNAMVITGLILSITGALAGNLRTGHAPDGKQVPLQPYEAYGICLLMSIYVLVFMILLP